MKFSVYMTVLAGLAFCLPVFASDPIDARKFMEATPLIKKYWDEKVVNSGCPANAEESIEMSNVKWELLDGNTAFAKAFSQEQMKWFVEYMHSPLGDKSNLFLNKLYFDKNDEKIVIAQKKYFREYTALLSMDELQKEKLIEVVNTVIKQHDVLKALRLQEALINNKTITEKQQLLRDRLHKLSKDCQS